MERLFQFGVHIISGCFVCEFIHWPWCSFVIDSYLLLQN